MVKVVSRRCRITGAKYFLARSILIDSSTSNSVDVSPTGTSCYLYTLEQVALFLTVIGVSR